MRFPWLSRALVVAAVATSPTTRAAEGDAAIKEQKSGAQQTFEAGGRLYDGKHFAEALVAFRASYQIVPSPNSHLMIGRTLRELGRLVEAYRELDATAEEATAKGPKYEGAGQAAKDELAELKQRLGLVTVKVATPADGLTVKLGDEALPLARLGKAEPVLPGAVRVSASAADGSVAESQVTVTGGSEQEVVLTLRVPEAAPLAPPPAPAPAPAPAPVQVTSSGVPLRTWAYVAGGVGVAGLATFGIFGAMSSSTYSSLEEACPGGRCPADKQGDIDSGKQQQLIANVGLGVGVVGLAAGVTLFFLGAPSKEAPPAAGVTGLRFGSRAVTLEGRF